MGTRLRILASAALVTWVAAFATAPLQAGPALTLEGSTTVVPNLVSVQFQGTVHALNTSTNLPPGVAVGDTIIGGFAYDPSQPGSAGLFTFTGSSFLHTFKFTIYDPNHAIVMQDTYIATGTNNKYQITSQNTGLGGDQWSLAALGNASKTTTINGVPTVIPPLFTLTLTSSVQSAPGPLPLPTAGPIPIPSNITTYFNSAANFTWDPDSDTGPLGFSASFEQTADNPTPFTLLGPNDPGYTDPGPAIVPEPSTWVTGAIGVGLCLVFHRGIRRRKGRVRTDTA